MKANLTIEKAFGQVIKDLRKSKKYSQEQLAEISNLDRTFISQLENGKKQPSLISIFQLAKAFNFSASRVLTLTEKKIKKAD